MKKIIGLFTITALMVGNGATIANAAGGTNFQPGLIDKQPKMPELPVNTGQPGQVQGLPQQPQLDDYRGSNRPLPTLTAITFNGSTVLSPEELNAIGDRYLDRPITENDIARLKFDVTKAYADKGNILVKVATPSQNLNTGNLVVNIYEGKVGRVIVQGDAMAHYVPEAFAHNLGGGVFDEKAATEVVNDLNEIKNTNSSITLKPGLEPITTDIILNVQDQPGEDENWIGADNYGAKLTGELEADAHLEKSNALGIGEKLYLDGRISEEQLYGLGGGFKVPTGFWNTYLEGSYNYSQNDIGDRLAFLNAEGESNIGEVAVSGNLVNNDFNKINLRSGLQARNHKETISGATNSYDKIRRLFVEASYLGLGADTLFLVNGRVSKGVNFLGASEKGDRITRAQADPEAWIFEPTLFVRHNFTPNDFLKFFARGQYANDVLLSSDLFAIGGYGSVRGFQPAQEVGERGVSGTLEYAHQFGITDNSYVEVGPWFDIAHVDNELPGQTTEDTLYSAGLGAKFGARFIPAGETSLRLDWAHPLSDTDKYTDVDDDSFYFRVQQDF